jgi:hypothetical protein
VVTSGSQALDEAYVPFFGAFGAARDDSMVTRWSANPFGMLWPERDAAFVTGGGTGGPRAAVSRAWWSLPGVSARVGSRRGLVSARLHTISVNETATSPVHYPISRSNSGSS